MNEKRDLTDRERLMILARFMNELLDAQQKFFNAPLGPQRKAWLKTCKALEAKARVLTAFALKNAPPEEPEPEPQTALDIDAPEPPAKTSQNAQLL